MLWLPPFLVLLCFALRLAELAHHFPAKRGKIESAWTFHLLTGVGAATALACLLEYFLAHRLIPWWYPAGGCALALAAYLLRRSARRALGQMWSVHVEIRSNHALVETGPYRFVRHPIYVAAVIELLGIPVTLRTPTAGTIGIVVYAAALIARVRTEEAAMLRTVGEPWREYSERTGAFFPRW